MSTASWRATKVSSSSTALAATPIDWAIRSAWAWRARRMASSMSGRDHVEVPGFQPAVQAGGIDVGADDDPAVHGHGQRLGAAHAAGAGGQGQGAGQRPAEAAGRRSAAKVS